MHREISSDWFCAGWTPYGDRSVDWWGSWSDRSRIRRGFAFASMMMMWWSGHCSKQYECLLRCQNRELPLPSQPKRRRMQLWRRNLCWPPCCLDAATCCYQSQSEVANEREMKMSGEQKIRVAARRLDETDGWADRSLAAADRFQSRKIRAKRYGRGGRERAAILLPRRPNQQH